MASSYLPSRKFAIVVLVFLLATGGLFLFFGGEAMKRKTPDASPQKRFIAGMFQGGRKDSDNDGLKDWEEVLWKTDPQNPDTDGDGTKDGEEVKLGRNPLIPAPGDEIPNAKYPSGTKTAPSAADESGKSGSVNLTKEIAKNISSRITSGAKNKSFDLSNPENLVKGAASDDINRFLAEFDPKISEKELEISNDNSSEAVKRYSESVGEIIFPKNYPAISEEDAIMDAIRYKNFSGIDVYISYYAGAIAKMKSVVVPSDFKDLHKKGVELLMASKKIDESMKEIAVDPLKSILAIQQYAKVKKEIAETLTGFAGLIKKYEK
ncbi:MAG: hypothetical protein GXP44_00460 [bacterium]|nr:hypothetical protein [bacterium]